MFERIVENLQKTDMEAIVLKLLNDRADEMLQMERSRLLEGLLSTGQQISPPYASSSYAEYKLKLNPLGVVDLTLTGAFTGAFIMSATSFPIFFGSLDEKSFSLIQKYGDDIFGETQEDLDKINEEIIPDIQAQLLNVLDV